MYEKRLTHSQPFAKKLTVAGLGHIIERFWSGHGKQAKLYEGGELISHIPPPNPLKNQKINYIGDIIRSACSKLESAWPLASTLCPSYTDIVHSLFPTLCAANLSQSYQPQNLLAIDLYQPSYDQHERPSSISPGKVCLAVRWRFLDLHRCPFPPWQFLDHKQLRQESEFSRKKE